MSEKDVKKSENGNFFKEIILPFLFAFAIILSICFSGLTLFQKRYFGRFFVNGQSMFPTLNLNAKDSHGNLYGEGEDGRPSTIEVGSYDIDYGIYDYHDQVLKNLKRFDIVICKYMSSDNSDKIKRVIALPGETFYLTRTKVGDEENGLLYLKNKDNDEYSLIEQPIDSYYVHKGDYPEVYSTPYTLGENEFFVMGDNRAHSNDSRNNGPIARSLIEGKVIALVANCSIGYSLEDEQFYPNKIDYYLPRYF